MKCDVCRKEVSQVQEEERGGKTLRICANCLEKEADSEACRCKETVGKSPSEVLKMVVRDMVGRKK